MRLPKVNDASSVEAKPSWHSHIQSQTHATCKSPSYTASPFVFNNTTLQMSLHIQIMAHVTSKSNGTALVHYNVPKKLNWAHILPSKTSDIPTQPPTMATCLQPLNGTAYVMGAVHINSETSKTSSMLNAHVRAPQQGVRKLYPAEMLPLHDDHSCPEPTYMKLYPTIIGNWEDNWRYVRYTTTPNIQMK